MKRFKLDELVIIMLVLAIVGILSFSNLKDSLRRSRDFQRKEDIKNLANALVLYNEDFGYYPLSNSEGKIVACGSNEDSKLKQLKPCLWGWDSLRDVEDPNYPAYLETVPADPSNLQGFNYRYISNGNHFQVFAALESSLEDEYRPEIAKRGLICGTQICNFGRSDSGTPLDKSLEEYENEMRDKSKKNLLP